jgi:hypothetical protein
MGCIRKYVVKFGSSHNISDLGDMVFILFVCDIYTNQLHFIKGSFIMFEFFFIFMNMHGSLGSSKDVNGIFCLNGGVSIRQSRPKKSFTQHQIKKWNFFYIHRQESRFKIFVKYEKTAHYI